MKSSLLILFGLMLGFGLGLVAHDAIGLEPSSTELWAFAGAFVGSALTVLGAVGVATYQINAHRGEAKELRSRQQLGARAVLASDLGHIVGYAYKSAAAAMRGDEVNTGGEPREHVPCPELEPDILLRLQRLVELLDGHAADHVVDLMHCYQIQHARLRGELDSLNFPDPRQRPGHMLHHGNFEFTFQRTVELHLRAESMFSFARHKQDSIERPPFPTEQVDNALGLLGVEDWLTTPERENIVELMTNVPSLGRWRRN